MTDLDKALKACLEDDSKQSRYYDLVLRTRFYIPTNDEGSDGQTEVGENETISPMILEADGKSHMMLFDSEERLAAWAKKQVSFVAFPGHVIARMTPPALHWAVNIGSGFGKEFIPDEISWLRDAATEGDGNAE